MQITGITPQKHDKLRCNIEVDGRFYCGMKLETVLQNRLKAGDSVTEEELAAIQLESEKSVALDKALTHISLTMKTEKEVRDFLRRKGYLQNVCDYVVERMKHHGFLDDGAYARAYAESAVRRKGKRLIAAELRRKGVGDEEAEAVLSELEGEEEGARRVLEKYLRGKPLDKKTLQKAYAYLIGKGYGYETARSALSALGGTDED